jgi:hypothetical protein
MSEEKSEHKIEKSTGKYRLRCSGELINVSLTKHYKEGKVMWETCSMQGKMKGRNMWPEAKICNG